MKTTSIIAPILLLASWAVVVYDSYTTKIIPASWSPYIVVGGFFAYLIVKILATHAADEAELDRTKGKYSKHPNTWDRG